MKFLLGFGIGVGLALMFAPAPGVETRRRLTEKAEDWAGAPQQKVREKVEEVARQSEAKAGEIGSRIGKETAEAVVRAIREEVVGNEGEKSA